MSGFLHLTERYKWSHFIVNTVQTSPSIKFDDSESTTLKYACQIENMHRNNNFVEENNSKYGCSSAHLGRAMQWPLASEPQKKNLFSRLAVPSYSMPYACLGKRSSLVLILCLHPGMWLHVLDHGGLTVADAGFLEGGFCYTIAREARAKILEATPTFG